MSYEERPVAVPGVVLWCRTPGRGGTPPTAARQAPSRILPDGCMDLVWDGRRLVVAGPDTRARWHEDAPGATYVGLRFARGAGPGLLGVAANEVTDRCPALEEVWSARAARTLTERVADDPVVGMERWVIERSGHGGRHIHGSLGSAVFEMAAAGVSVSDLSNRLGMSARHLHRACLPLFGYGPRHLRRVLRLGRALDLGRAGLPLAGVAARSGYADQAHLSREVRDLVGTTPSRLLRQQRSVDG